MSAAFDTIKRKTILKLLVLVTAVVRAGCTDMMTKSLVRYLTTLPYTRQNSHMPRPMCALDLKSTMPNEKSIII